MSTTYEQLHESALALPLEERIKLADMLALNLRGSELWQLHAGFTTELKRRSAEMDEDPSASMDWQDVRAEMEKPSPA